MTSDGRMIMFWFVEQQSNKIGTVKMTEIPVSISQVQESNDVEIKYTELASPLVALGIIVTSFIFCNECKGPEEKIKFFD